MSFNRLPNELAELILVPNCGANIRSVCRLWLTIHDAAVTVIRISKSGPGYQFGDRFPSLTTFAFRLYAEMTYETFGNISTLTTITSLELSCDWDTLDRAWSPGVLLMKNRAVGVLSTLTALQSLTLRECRITEELVQSLKPLTGLRYLDLTKNELASINETLAGFLSVLTALKTLNLSDNYLTCVTGLSSLSGLTGLNLSNNGLRGLTGLSTLHSLTQLNLSDNLLSSAAGLSSLTALTDLNLSGNLFSSATGLSSLTTLTTLDLADNMLNCVAGLASLTALTFLDMSKNGLDSVTSLTYF